MRRASRFAKSFKRGVLLRRSESAQIKNSRQPGCSLEGGSVLGTGRKNRGVERIGLSSSWFGLGEGFWRGNIARSRGLIPGNCLPCLSFDRRLRSEWQPPVFEADLDCLLSILEIRQAANFEPVQHKVIRNWFSCDDD